MRKLNVISLTALLVVAYPALALTPVATVTSADVFAVNGESIAPAGVAPWPLLVGNDVSTFAAPAVLFFPDGSSVKLAPASRAKLMGSESRPKLVLIRGSLDYKVVLGSNVSVTNLDLERRR